MARLSGKSHKGLTCTLNYRAGQYRCRIGLQSNINL